MPHFFQNKPLPRLIAPGIHASHRNADTLGRALDMLSKVGVTELYSLIAATAAKRLGLPPTFAQLESTSFHVDGRYNSDEEPEEHVIHITRGSSRAQRPDLKPVRLALLVAHQARIPVLMNPRSGHRSDAHDCGPILTAHMAQLQTTYGTTFLGADSALSSADNLEKLAAPRLQWITRVPATLCEAQAVLAQAAPQTMAPLTEGYRYHVVPSSYGGVEQGWVLIHSEPRQPQAQRTVDKQGLKQSTHEVNAFKTLCRTAFACEADAHQALTRFTHDVQTTFLQDSTIYHTPMMASGGAQALAPSPTRASTISPELWHLGSRTARRVSTSTAVFSSRQTHWTRASYPRRPYSTDTQGKPRRNADCASCKTHSFWRPPAISKSLNALWRC